MILLIKKKPAKPKGRSLIWYDPFFQESVTLECDGYTIKTKYSPYCILNDKPVKIDKAIELFKEHNSIGYEDDAVLALMKSQGIVYYDYIQEPEIHNSPENNDISPQDMRKLNSLLNNFSLNYVFLGQKTKGITIEIDENDQVEDFLLEISRDYEYKER